MNPDIAEHILILKDYMEAQKEFVALMGEQPSDEFELNSYTVRVREVEDKFDKVASQLHESIHTISKIS